MDNYFVFSKFLFLFPLSFIVAFCISRFEMPMVRYRPLLLFSLSFIFAAFFWKVPEINPDVTRYFQYAKYLELNGVAAFLSDWGTSIWVHTDLIAEPFLYGIIFKVFGEVRLYIQIFITFLFSLTSVTIFYIGKHLFTEEVGFHGSLIFLTIPHFLSQVALTLVDVPTTFFISLSILLFILSIKSEGSKSYLLIIATAFSLFLSVYSKETSLLVFIVVLPALAFYYGKKNSSGKRVFVKSFLIIILSSCLILSFLYLKYDVIVDQYSPHRLFSHISQKFERVSSITNIASVYTGSGGTKVYPISFFYQVGGVVILLCFSSFIIFLRKKNWNYFPLLVWVIFPLLLLVNTRLRYLMIIYPAIALMAAISLNSIKMKYIRQYFVASIILVSLTMSLFVYLPFMHNHSDANMLRAAEYTNKFLIPNTALFIIYDNSPHPGKERTLAPIFDYYSNSKIDYFNYEKFAGFEKKPTSIIIVSDRIYPNKMPSSLSELLKTDYRLVHAFTSGRGGIWSPCITTVYRRFNLFVENFESAEKFIQTRSGIKEPLSKSMVKVTRYVQENEMQDAILLHPPDNGGSYLIYSNISIPMNARLKGGIALNPAVWDSSKGDGVLFQILIKDETINATVFSSYIDPKNIPGDRKIHFFNIDLSPYAEEEIDIIFLTEPGKNSLYDESLWVDPTIEH